jgi:glycosyltransferase involved in cell wall biosynthesis
MAGEEVMRDAASTNLPDIETISVIVPVYNGEATIRGAVERILGQTVVPEEVIVVDDGSTDGTAAVLASFGSRICVLRQRNQGPAAARNAGIRASRGHYLAMTDSDCYPEPAWLAQLLSGFDDKSVGGTGGIVRGARPTLIGDYLDRIGLLDAAPDASGEIPYVITANACYRRSALLEAGLFDESFRRPGGEEAELGRRVRACGYRFRRVEGAIVGHEHRQDLVSLLRTLATYGEGAARLATLWPEAVIPRPGRRLLRQLAAVRTWRANYLRHRTEVGRRRALCFAMLDYLREPSFLWGYRRGQRLEESSQRHHSLL